MQGGFDGGTVGIFRKDQTRERRPWNSRPGNRGSFAGRRGKPWRAAVDEQVSDRRQDAGLELEDWNDRGDDCGRITRDTNTSLQFRKIIISLKTRERNLRMQDYRRLS